jgi:hypothetical protein
VGMGFARLYRPRLAYANLGHIESCRKSDRPAGTELLRG